MNDIFVVVVIDGGCYDAINIVVFVLINIDGKFDDNIVVVIIDGRFDITVVVYNVVDGNVVACSRHGDDSISLKIDGSTCT